MSGHVVVVDDSLTVRMDLGDAFSEAGFHVVLCSTIEKARQAIRGTGAVAVVLDVVLPDGDGLNLLSELKKDPETANLPIVLLSSESEVRDRIQGLTRGADEYIGKPYDAEYVVARVRQFVQEPVSRRAGGTTILVIDDSATYRSELAEHLESIGYRAVVAHSGEVGLRRAAEVRPDAIVVDGMMPAMDGPTFIRHLRLDPGLNSTPCVLLTASDGPQAEIDALDAGADAYARKAEDWVSLDTRINAVLRAAGESRGVKKTTSAVSPKKILAVDDSMTYLEELVEQLRREGYEVVRAQSGEDALSLLAVEPVDCVLLDHVMSGLSGTETCRRIKAAPSIRNTPVLILTAQEDRESLVEGINAGADDYVGKSSSFEVIRARVRALLRRKQFEDENRRIRDDLLRNESEAKVAKEVAAARQELLYELSKKNEELRFHVDELRRLNRELESFAYSVSHDLRQPLRAMDGFSQVLLERYSEQLDEQGLHYLRRIRAGAGRMNDLLHAILTLSRVSRKGLELEHVDLRELAEDVVKHLRESEPSREVRVVLDSDLHVKADRHMMESVVENLLGNAWKFTAKSANATIEMGRERSPQEAMDVFYVKDNGVGFDMSYADKLFGPFQRLHSKSEFEGTGIGLATVQRIIHRHGGKIWAESQPGEGAKFGFSLPVARGGADG